MATIAEVRAQYPQYHDMSDRALADALHAKYYSDVPKDEFDAKVGLKAAPADKPSRGIIGEIGDAVGGAVDKLKTDVRQGVAAAGKPAKTIPEAVGNSLTGLGRTATLVGDVVGIPGAAVGAVQNALVSRPYGKAVSALTGGAYPEDRGQADMNTALMAAMPGKAALVSAAPKVSALAQGAAKFEQAGVRPTLAALTPGGGALAKVAAETPIVGARSRNALAASINDTEQAAGRTAAKYGQASSRGATGEAVQEGVKGFNDRFRDRSETLYNKAFADIDAGQQAAVAANQKSAALRNGQMANFQAAPAPVVAPTATQTVLGQMGGRVSASPLSDIISDPRLKSIAGALESGKQDLRFGDLRALRTWVREAKGNETLRQGIDQASLGRLEGALTTDITDNAQRLAGPEAARRLKQADTFYRLGSQRIEGALQTFVGKGAAAPKAGESTYDVILRAAGDKGGADAARLVALKKSLQPHEWGDVAATTIDRMGAPTAGAADAGPFSVSRFTTNYATLSPQGKSLLFGNAELRKELENLNEVAGMQKGVERAANTSNTATATRAGVMGAAALNPGMWLPAAKVLGGLALTGEAMTNPVVVRWLTRSARAAQQGQKPLGVVSKQLRLAAGTNAALAPLSHQVQLLLESPKAATGVAATQQDQTGQ